MKLMFNKKDFHGKWFSEDENFKEDESDYTEKAPPDTFYEWNEDQNDWVKKEVNIEEPETSETDPDTETTNKEEDTINGK